MKKIQVEGKKYLCFGPLRVRYETDRSEEIRKLTIGPINLFYRYDEKSGAVYLVLFGREICIIPGETEEVANRRIRHYQLRNKLSERRCQKILETELTPLLGYKLNLEEPTTFNEKINWLKLHYHNPMITVCCDKYAVKEYAAQVIGEQYVLPVLGTWNHAADIDFEALPDSFVLKVNWSSGYNIIVSDKSKLDTEAARTQLNKWMQPECNSYYDTFNWGYKNMIPVIYAEPYIEQVDGQVYDYKFFMCNGKFEFMFIATNRQNEKVLTHDFFDSQFNHLPFDYGGRVHADKPLEKPVNFEKMIELATKLAKPFPFVRVDFYEVGDRVYLGEMTFYPGGGTLKFNPVSWDYMLGEKIVLDSSN